LNIEWSLLAHGNSGQLAAKHQDPELFGNHSFDGLPALGNNVSLARRRSNKFLVS
jgi:hypothetical protein